MEYKITVLGSGGVGKTAFTIQMCSSHFVEYYDPTIESSYRRQVVIDDQACMLDILDTAGQEEYSALRSQWIRSGQGFLVLYSVTDKPSLTEALTFRRQVLHVKDADESDPPAIVLVGNKCDLVSERQIVAEEGKAVADEWGAPFFEASAKTRLNVEEAFFALVRQIRLKEGGAAPGGPSGDAVKGAEKGKKKGKGGGCVLF